MKYPIFSVRDIHVGFNAPLVEVNEHVAKRNFAQAVNSLSNGAMNYAPKDYDLYRLGEFDLETGEIIPEKVPVLVVTGLSVYNVEVK